MNYKTKPENPWPDTFEEAMEITQYWGLCCFGISRYIVCPSGSAQGLAVNARGTRSSKEEMKKYWKGDGLVEVNEYYFKPFMSERDLYQWMAEGGRE